jgi:hypothetical protein
MYLKINKLKREKTKFWYDTKIMHIALYKDDWSFVKFVKHTDEILDKITKWVVEVTIPEIEWVLQEQDIEKILQHNK